MSSRNLTDRRARSPKPSRRTLIDNIIRSHNPDGRWVDYWRVIDTVRSRTDLLSPRRARWGDSGFRRVARACKRLAQHTYAWVRQPEFWCGTEANSPQDQWRDFSNHLLHCYDAPRFLAPMWLKDYLESWHRDLHFHLGEGLSIRTFDIPEFGRVSKSIARWFMQAPAHANVNGALRWAQIRALGGDAALATFVMDRFNVHIMPNAAAWVRGLFAFIVRNQSLSNDEMLDILAFAKSQRFIPARQTVGPWMGDEPVDRDFNLQDWTLRRLRRHMANWREAYPTAVDIRKFGWQEANYRPFDEILAGTRWHIIELCTPRALRIEGRMMNHCIANYERQCRNRHSSIWSLRRSLQDGRTRRVVTIDIDPRRDTIREVNGKANSKPADLPMRVLSTWAKREGLASESVPLIA